MQEAARAALKKCRVNTKRNKQRIRQIPRALFPIFKNIMIFEANQSVVSTFYTFIKHAKGSQSESLLE